MCKIYSNQARSFPRDIVSRGDSFPFNFEPNGFQFGSKSKGKLSPRTYPIQFERKWKHSFLSVEKCHQTAN